MPSSFANYFIVRQFGATQVMRTLETSVSSELRLQDRNWFKKVRSHLRGPEVPQMAQRKGKITP